MAQTAARVAAGSGPLAELAKRQQDLAAQAVALDRERAQALAQGDRAREAAASDKLQALGARLDEVQAALARDFPQYAELVSPAPCRPFDAQRDGISLGEAAGFALLERADAGDAAAPLLLGYGEASDAHHMSTPHPQGLGAERALDDALARAGVSTAAIDYINMHGTASTKNDEVEAALVARRFPATTHASSTKGFTGHTLGAAGIVEAVISLLALESGGERSGLARLEIYVRAPKDPARPLAPARLRLANTPWLTYSEAVTEATADYYRGRLLLRNLPPGDYTGELTRQNRPSLRVPLTLRAGETRRLAVEWPAQ